MEKIFRLVLELSYAGTWVIAAVLLLRCLLRRLPKKFSYVLWIIPGIRLLFPISFTGIWGMLGKWETADSKLMIPRAMKAIQNTVKAGNGMEGINRTETVVSGIQPENSILLVMGVMAVFWAVGMGFLIGYGVASIICLKRKLQISIKWKENIYLADGISTPFVFTGFPDKIYLPSELGEEECQYILLHEQFHIKRKDTLFKLLAFFILCIHWFNPVVWAGVYFFSRDMEMSCDEAVIAGLDRRGKQEYAKELLRFSVNSQQWIQFAVSFAEKGVKGRIMNLLQKKSKTKRAAAMGTAVVIMAGAALLPDFLGQGLTKAASGEKAVEVLKKEYVVKKEQPIEVLQKEYEETNGEYGYPTEISKYQGKEAGKKHSTESKTEELSYREAFSEEEDLEILLEKVKKYYQKKHQWEVIDYRLAEDDSCGLYQVYKDTYELGNLIVFHVHTTYNPSGLYRDIAFGRKSKNADWKWLNEGV